MKYRSVFQVIVFFGGLSIAVFAVAAENEVRLANLDYPPYAGPSLKHGGFLTQITTEAFKRSGYTVDYQWLTWARGYDEAKKGNLDGTCVAWHSEEREKWFIYSEPLPASEIVFYKRKEAKITFNGDYAALQPYQIGVVRGYVNPPGFEEIAFRLNVQEVARDFNNLKKLLYGRIDLAIIDRHLARHLINSDLPEAKDVLAPMSPVLKKEVNYIIFSKSAPNIEAKVAAFNKGLSEMNAEGRVSEILKLHGF